MTIINEKPSKIISGIRYYDTEKLAKILGINIYTVRIYFKTNKFPKFKIQRRYYLSEQNLKNYLLAKGLKSLSNNELIEVINQTIRKELAEYNKKLIPEIRKNTRQVLNIYEKRFRESLKEEKKIHQEKGTLVSK